MHVLIKTPTNRQTGMQIYEGQAYRGQNGVRKGREGVCCFVYLYSLSCVSVCLRATEHVF